MDVFDRFLIGDTGTIEWNFENTHFIQRLNKYRIIANKARPQWQFLAKEK